MSIVCIHINSVNIAIPGVIAMGIQRAVKSSCLQAIAMNSIELNAAGWMHGGVRAGCHASERRSVFGSVAFINIDKHVDRV